MIKSINIINFKGIENLTVNFDEKITCLSGSNGTGKSSTHKIWSDGQNSYQGRNPF